MFSYGEIILTTVHTLASGSSGNALLFSCGSTHILVDAGISCRRITTSLKALGLGLDDLDGLLITHCHTDHIAGLQTLLKRSSFPIFGSGRTCRELAYRLAGIHDRLEELPMMRRCSLGGCTVTAFPTSHDSPGSCGYRLDGPAGSLGVLTDTGFVTEEARDVLPGVQMAVLEANHDVEAVRSGPYPYYLKARILGSEGHLNHEDAARFAVELAEHGASELILAHLSQENNTPAMAQHAVETALGAAGLSPILCVAPRHELSAAHVIQESVCRK